MSSKVDLNQEPVQGKICLSRILINISLLINKVFWKSVEKDYSVFMIKCSDSHPLIRIIAPFLGNHSAELYSLPHNCQGVFLLAFRNISPLILWACFSVLTRKALDVLLFDCSVDLTDTVSLNSVRGHDLWDYREQIVIVTSSPLLVINIHCD